MASRVEESEPREQKQEVKFSPPESRLKGNLDGDLQMHKNGKENQDSAQNTWLRAPVLCLNFGFAT